MHNSIVMYIYIYIICIYTYNICIYTNRATHILYILIYQLRATKVEGVNILVRIVTEGSANLPMALDQVQWLVPLIFKLCSWFP